MAQDRPKQPNIQRELVRAAIIKLRHSGLEISPHTVAVEANIPRSTIYRNAELMELINKEGGVGIQSESPFQASAEERIAELQAHIQEQDQHLWDLEKENEDLHSEVENAWTMGFQAGLAEASRRHNEPESEPLSAQTALSKVTGEHPLFRSTGNHAALKPKPTTAEMAAGGEITGDHQAYTPDRGITDESVYQIDAESDEVAIKMSISGGHTPIEQAAPAPKPAAAAPQAAPEPAPQPAPQAAPQPKVQAAPPQTTPQPQPQPDRRHVQPAASSDSVQALPAAPAQAPVANRAQSQTSAATSTATSDIYNATRSGPYTGNTSNPLVELSWKDLETVYNFRVESLMDYSRNIPSASSPAKPLASSERGNGASRPIISDYIDPEILQMLPSDEDIASLQNLEARVYMSQDGDNGHSANARQGERLVSQNADPPYTPPNPPYQSEIEPVPQDAPYEYYAQPEPPSRPHPDETGDRIEAMPDPRLADGEHVVDLDSLDIFDDIDDYNIETLTGHAKRAAADDAAGLSTAGEELRNLIKGRIQSAAELPYESMPSKVSPKASATDLPPVVEELGGGMASSRSKFIGGSKGGAAANEPRKPSFVVKQIPPEIRKASHILGLRPEELTQTEVIAAWKTLITSPGVHPDVGGDHDSAVFLNIAKDTLVRWLDQQAPKLGKKFGQPSDVTKPPNKPEQH
jgi:hypothetical protein